MGQALRRREDPHFLPRPGRGRLRQGQALRPARHPPQDPHPELAGADLHAQPLVGVEPGRQVSAHRDRGRIREQSARERHLPRLARDLEDDAGLRPERHPVLDAAKNLEGEALGLGRRARSLSEDQEALLVPHRERDRLALHRQVQQSDADRDRQRVGEAIPGEASFDPVGARGDPDGGAVSRLQDDRGGTVEANGLRPAPFSSRERNVEHPVGKEVEAERPAPLVDGEAKPAGPEARGARAHDRAQALLRAVDGPWDPVAERSWDLRLGESVGPGLRRANRHP